MRRPARTITVARCLLAGVTIAASIPPWGWWPLAFVGVAQWDRLLADQSPRRRFGRSWLVAAAWLYPAMLWMYDLTAPGYVVAGAFFAAFFALTTAAVPASAPARWVALPGAIALAELWRWTWPFGGVPLATLAQSQAAAPLAQAARLGSAIAVSGLVAVGGVSLSAAWDRRWRPAAVAGGVLVVATLGGWLAPHGGPAGEPLQVAVVQGGGEQRTRAATSDADVVFARHVEATDLIEGEVDLIVWPENVVSLDGLLPGSVEDRTLSELARNHDATLIAGVTEDDSPTTFRNASVVYNPDGTRGDRYDKVRRVPFGEYVPFRDLMTSLAGGAGLPRRDAVPGTEPAVVDTVDGPMGVVISWEVFFTDRADDAIDNGGQALLNPTNGASYWLTQVQTQQVASSRLRGIETGRWVLQAAPTGLSAIADPDGAVVTCTLVRPGGTTEGTCRSDVSEQVVLQATIDRRTGPTIARAVDAWPTLLASIAALIGANVWDRRRRGRDDADGAGVTPPAGA